MPRKIPPSRFPTSAKEDYTQALIQALEQCFQQLSDDLLAIPELQVADAGEPDPLLQAIERTRAANEKLKQSSEQLRRQLAGSKTSQAFDSARSQWRALDQQLQQAITQTSRQVRRVAENSVQRQIDAAFSNRRLAVGLNQPLFGEIQAEVDRFTRENALLVKDLGEKALRDLEILTQDVVSRGGAADELAPLLAKQLGIAERRAQTIAHHQVSRLNGQISRIRLKSALSIGYRWVHSGNPNPRQAHKALDGQIRDWDDSPMPGEDVNCGCGFVPIFDGDDAKPRKRGPRSPKKTPGFDWDYINQSTIAEQDKETLKRLEQIKDVTTYRNELVKLETVEVLAIFTKRGHKIFEFVGDIDQVNPDPRFLRNLQDKIVMHNHPTGQSFSNGDLAVFRFLNPYKTIVTGNRLEHRFTYFITRQPGHDRWRAGDMTINDLPVGEKIDPYVKRYQAEFSQLREDKAPESKEIANNLKLNGTISKDEVPIYERLEQVRLMCEGFEIDYQYSKKPFKR